MIDLKEFLKAGVHFGHRSSRWSPKMRPFIWGCKNRIHLIDISKTAFLLERAGKYLKDQASNGKSFLWVGTKKPAQLIIKKMAETLKMPFVVNRWIGGTLTNFDQVKKAIKKLVHLKDIIAKTSPHYTKKEVSEIQKEISRLEKKIGGVVDLVFPPAAIIVVDANKEHSAVREAIVAQIPIIAMIDTNSDPSGINFIIPANDDSPRSIELIISYLTTCALEGQKEFEQTKAKEEKEKKEKEAPKTPALKKTIEKKEPSSKEKKPAISKPTLPAKATKKPTEEIIKEKTETMVEEKKEAKKIEVKEKPVKKEPTVKQKIQEKAVDEKKEAKTETVKKTASPKTTKPLTKKQEKPEEKKLAKNPKK